MDWEATGSSWTGGQPGRDHGLPRLPVGFDHRGPWETAAPSAALASALEHAAGPEGRYPDAGTDALIGIARQRATIESWAAWGKLAALRAMAREDSDGRPLLRRRSDVPDGWDDSLTYEISGALAMGPVSAGNLASLAWTLGTRLAGIGRLLANGTLTMPKARLVAQLFEPLDDDEAALAEALLLGELAGKTYPQVERLAWRAALAVAPDAAERRRSTAEREHARVTVFREESGAVGLSGRDLRYQVGSYLPGDRLRRLVQVRDHECTWPPCSRPARESDFEHAVPHDKGGATCACNAGARSRRCHQVKQLPGWTVTQPKPGWHVWKTPTGRTYVQEPWRYTA